MRQGGRTGRAAMAGILVVSMTGTTLSCASSPRDESPAATGAGAGAAIGALVGLALGAGAGGAAIGAAAGAAGGAVIGAATGESAAEREARQGAEARSLEEDRQAMERRQELKREEQAAIDRVGIDVVLGWVALRDCRFDEAEKHNTDAAQAQETDYRVAAHWLEALIAAERADNERASAAYAELVEADPEVRSIQNAAGDIDMLRTELHVERRQMSIRCTAAAPLGD